MSAPASRLVLSLLLAFALTGCARHRQAGPDYLLDPLDARSLGYNMAWASHIGLASGDQVAHAVVLGDLAVFVERPDNIVTAVRMSDGSLAWKLNVGSPIDTLFEPFRVDDVIYVNSPQEVHCIKADTGRLLDRQQLDYAVGRGPVVFERYAIFASVSGTLFAHDVDAGFPKWKYDLGHGIATRPVIVGASVFAATKAGNYAMLSAREGEVLWVGRTHDAVTAQPVASTVALFIPSRDSNLYCVARATGRDRWVFNANRSITDDPAVMGNYLLLRLPGDELVCLNASSGAVLWRQNAYARPLQLLEQTLYLSKPGFLQTLDAESGRSLLEVPTKRLVAVRTGPAGELLLVSPSGRLAAFTRLK